MIWMVTKDEEDLYDLLRTIFAKGQKKFVPGITKIHYAEAVYDQNEIYSVLQSLLSGWLGLGRNAHEFEKEFAKFIGTRHCILTNSGTSSNLLSVGALDLPTRTEALVSATNFPTTLSVLIRNNLKPVFMDINPKTYNIDPEAIERCLTKKTRLIMLVHSLGNPNEMDAIMEIAEKHNLAVVEDVCDALGSKYDGKYLPARGNLGTFSFYPAHQITLGGGGAVVTDSDDFNLKIRSLRDWGRACTCDVCKLSLDKNAICPLRFSKTPIKDYDKRFTYINIGYNLQPMDLQAAMGLCQMKRLPEFIEKRKSNFKQIYSALSRYERYFILPESLSKADPCWFAFPITVRKDAPFKRKDIVGFLEKHNIDTRPLYSGNLLKQPAFKNISYRTPQNLTNSDYVMKSGFFIGLHQGLTEEMLAYMLQTFEDFMRQNAWAC
jgi:CDP-6-deoxy-D-xylo-4-hexulose-3-dehydrase